MRIYLSGPAGEFEAVAPCGVDLADRFDAFDVESRQWMVIYGWRCDLERISGPNDGDELPAGLRAWNRLGEAERAAVLARVGERENQQAQFRACLAAMNSVEPLNFVSAA